MRRLYATIAVAAVLLSGVAVAGPPGPPAARAAGATSVYLPWIAAHARPQPACPADSPFSIQIAALHQIVPGGTGLSPEREQAAAKWLEWYNQAYPSLVAALRASGACWTRVLVNWSAIQPVAPLPGEPPGYNWADHDEKLGLVGQTGLRMIGTVDVVPDWAGRTGDPLCAPALSCGPVHPDRYDEFGQFLTDLVTRYGQPPYNIHTWELRNEPDGTFAELAWGGIGCGGYCGAAYAEMAAVAQAAIKAADPQARLIMGGVAYDWFVDEAPNGKFNRYFPDDVMANGGAVSLDAITFHYFPDFHAEWERWVPDDNPPTCGVVDDGLGAPYDAWGVDLIAKASHFRNRLYTCFGVDKPLWVTELAEHGFPGDDPSLARQARYVIQGYVRGLAAGVENITWFALVSPPYDVQEQGLLYQDTLEPKPAFIAYQALASELDGYHFLAERTVAGGEAYVFTHPDQANRTVAWGSGVLDFAPAGYLRIVDRSGGVSYVLDGGAGDADGAQNGSVGLQLTADPVFVSSW